MGLDASSGSLSGMPPVFNERRVCLRTQGPEQQLPGRVSHGRHPLWA